MADVTIRENIVVLELCYGGVFAVSNTLPPFLTIIGRPDALTRLPFPKPGSVDVEFCHVPSEGAVSGKTFTFGGEKDRAV